MPGQKLLVFLAVGVLDLSVLLGIGFAVFTSYMSVIHLMFALGAAITLHYVSWKYKRQGLSMQLVGLAWLAAILVILTPVIG